MYIFASGQKLYGCCLVSCLLKVQNTQNMKIVSMNCKDNNEFFSQLVFLSTASDSRSIKCTFLVVRCLLFDKKLMQLHLKVEG